MTKFDQGLALSSKSKPLTDNLSFAGKYTMPLNISYASVLLDNILCALTYRANCLHLILIGRIVTGFGFTSPLYSKRYSSDPRVAGVRRRTMLSSCLVVGRGFGFSTGSLVGGLLYKIGFANAVFNGFTSPGWLMAGVWAIFWLGASGCSRRAENQSGAESSIATSDPRTRSCCPLSTTLFRPIGWQ